MQYVLKFMYLEDQYSVRRPSPGSNTSNSGSMPKRAELVFGYAVPRLFFAPNRATPSDTPAVIQEYEKVTRTLKHTSRQNKFSALKPISRFKPHTSSSIPLSSPPFHRTTHHGLESHHKPSTDQHAQPHHSTNSLLPRQRLRRRNLLRLHLPFFHHHQYDLLPTQSCQSSHRRPTAYPYAHISLPLHQHPRSLTPHFTQPPRVSY